MKYYLDTEFIEDGKTIDLISIGIVAEDGREHYAVSTEFSPANASDWVVKNVLEGLPPMQSGPSADLFLSRCDDRWVPTMVDPLSPYYHKRDETMAQEWKPRSVIAGDILEFIGDDPKPEFWGYFCATDWVAFYNLWGRLIDKPSQIPFRCNDLRQMMMHFNVDKKSLPPKPEDQHNALADARWNKSVYDSLAPMAELFCS